MKEWLLLAAALSQREIKEIKKRFYEKRMRLCALHTYKIQAAFERPVTKIKIFCEYFMNGHLFDGGAHLWYHRIKE